MNVSWSWKRHARRVFQALDDSLWHLTRHNPIAILRRVDPGRLSECARDPRFLAEYDAMMEEFRREREWQDTWFAADYADLPRERPVAYFCAEFGLHNSVPIYSGGLGVLAGDHCKASSDLGVPLVGVGLFYTKGYFDQKLRLDGWQEDSDERFDVVNAPLERLYSQSREPFLARLETSGRIVHIGVWRMLVGRVPVYLLDTNLEQNHEDDRDLTAKLYIGGPQVRLKQEWILGVGGVRALRALGVEPAAWHANEGHAAFMMVERVRELTARGVSFDDAVKEVRAHSVFTTHTPVPAGHDTFSFEDLARCSGSDLGPARRESRHVLRDRGASYRGAGPLSHDRGCAAIVKAREWSIAAAWRRVAAHLVADVVRSRSGSRAYRAHHQRRARPDVDGARNSGIAG